MKFLDGLRGLASQGSIWGPPWDLTYELRNAHQLGLLRGRVLNSGAGERDISAMIDGVLVNQDIAWTNERRTHIDIYCSADALTCDDNTFDTVLSIAVLEHVENPEQCVAEFYRVLRPGGHVVASVPFLQPEHKVPTDFQRYTKDGLDKLFRAHGFETESIEPLFTIYHTLHWIIYEATTASPSLASKLLRYVFLPPLALLARHSRHTSDVLASGFQIIARKPRLL